MNKREQLTFIKEHHISFADVLTNREEYAQHRKVIVRYLVHRKDGTVKPEYLYWKDAIILTPLLGKVNYPVTDLYFF